MRPLYFLPHGVRARIFGREQFFVRCWAVLAGFVRVGVRNHWGLGWCRADARLMAGWACANKCAGNGLDADTYLYPWPAMKYYVNPR